MPKLNSGDEISHNYDYCECDIEAMRVNIEMLRLENNRLTNAVIKLAESTKDAVYKALHQPWKESDLHE